MSGGEWLGGLWDWFANLRWEYQWTLTIWALAVLVVVVKSRDYESRSR